MTEKKAKDPLFGAAVLRRTFELRKEEQSPQFELVYQGVLRDVGLTDEEVVRYLADHRAEVDAAIAGRRGRP